MGRRFDMLSRRDLVGKLAAGTAVLLAAGSAQKSFASVRSEAAAEEDRNALVPQGANPSPQGNDVATLSAPAPWEVLHPLAVGSVVAHGWSVAGFTGAVDGSCVLTLQNDKGRSHRVHLTRNDGAPQGIVYTKNFDLVVMNGGRGDLPTDEGFAQAVAEVAHVLAANESGQGSIVTALLPQAERVRRFGGMADARLR
jgi:hypothetical protein